MTSQSLISEDVFDGIEGEMARRHHLDFMAECWVKSKPFIIGYHTRKICEKIDDAIAKYRQGKDSFIIIEVPFRHGKSDIISRYLPAHYFGLFPDNEILVATHAQGFSNNLSRFARNLVRSKKYKKVFPDIKLSAEAASIEHWEISGRAGCANWAGVAGTITGEGYDLGIIDDFLKNRQAAESRTIRDGQWEWFTDVFLTRRAPVSITVILVTPWHIDDLIGRIQKKNDEKSKEYDPDFPKFEVIRFPAKDDSYVGGYLFLDRFSEQWYKSHFAALGTYGAAGLLQCSPVARGGNMLKTVKVDIISASKLPLGLTWVRGWDLASSEKERTKDNPDYTAGVKLAIKFVKKKELNEGVPILYIADVCRMQAEAPERNRRIKQVAILDGDLVRVGIESVAGYKDSYTILKDALSGLRTVKKILASKDKVVRASVLEPIFEAGNVFLVEGHWNTAYINEIEAFPSGEHDDQVDATVCAYEMLTGTSRLQSYETEESIEDDPVKLLRQARREKVEN